MLWVNYVFAFSQNEKTFCFYSQIVEKFRRTFCVGLLIFSVTDRLTIVSAERREERARARTELEINGPTFEFDFYF